MQIRCFLEAAKSLNFTFAASSLYISQSTLSKSIISLEEELGLQLFIRNRRGIRLTPGGELLCRHFSALEAEYSQWIEQARMANQGLSGTLKVGYLATQHINADCARVISLFEQKYQNINIIVQYENFKGLLNKLRRGEIDIAFTTTFEVEQETDLAYQEFVRVKNLLIVPDAYPLKRPELREKPHPALSEFADETFLTVDEQESGAITTLILQSCSLAGFRPHLCVAPDLETLLLWLELGRGIFALNEEHTIYLSNQIKTFELEEFPPITLSATWLKQTVNPCVSLLTGELPKLDEKLSLL